MSACPRPQIHGQALPAPRSSLRDLGCSLQAANPTKSPRIRRSWGAQGHPCPSSGVMAQGMEPRGEAPVFIQMENSLCEVTSEVEVHKRAQRATQKPFVTLPVGAGEGPPAARGAVGAEGRGWGCSAGLDLPEVGRGGGQQPGRARKRGKREGEPQHACV